MMHRDDPPDLHIREESVRRCDGENFVRIPLPMFQTHVQRL